jgi:hypothetical protein
MSKNIFIICATIIDNFLFNYETYSNDTHSGIVRVKEYRLLKYDLYFVLLSIPSLTASLV